jgi:hypothetical protein
VLDYLGISGLNQHRRESWMLIETQPSA